MSTCRGATAPHENCPHGKACDWRPTDADLKTLADLDAIRAKAEFLALDGRPALNRADRRAAAKATRRAR